MAGGAVSRMMVPLCTADQVPDSSWYFAKTHFTPSPDVRVHALPAVNASEADQATPLLDSCICEQVPNWLGQERDRVTSWLAVTCAPSLMITVPVADIALILRMRLNWSAIRMFPAVSTNRSVGKRRLAEAAGPLSPAYRASPSPATVVIMP